jgi:hypothetical protein
MGVQGYRWYSFNLDVSYGDAVTSLIPSYSGESDDFFTVNSARLD